jgi:hypothetical protein
VKNSIAEQDVQQRLVLVKDVEIERIRERLNHTEKENDRLRGIEEVVGMLKEECDRRMGEMKVYMNRIEGQ